MDIFSEEFFFELALQNRHRQPRNRGEFAIVTRHSDFPDLCGAADANGFCNARDPAAPCRTQVVAVDFESDGEVRRGIQDHVGSDAADRFGQNDRCAAVKQAKSLRGAVVNRHATFQKIRPDFREFESHMGKHVDVVVLCNFFQGIRTVPHGIFFWCFRTQIKQNPIPKLCS
jgi:hypothetical protein